MVNQHNFLSHLQQIFYLHYPCNHRNNIHFDYQIHPSILFVKQEFVQPLEEYIKKNYSDTLRSRYWGEGDLFHIVEIYNINVNKGCGLESAISYYNIKKENVIAIGDGHNDIEMFNIASVKVAMGNSHPELLPHANVITKSNKDKGVYLFLKDYFKI